MEFAEPLASVPREIAGRLSAFRETLVRALPTYIDDVVLFGSHARGDARQGSDYDVAVILAPGLEADQVVRHAISDIAYDYIIDGLDLSPIALGRGDFGPNHQPRTELAARVLRDGVAIP